MSEELETPEVENEVTESPELEAETVEEQVEEYTPSYSYKFKDEERSFDDRLHSVIKDKDTEEYLRDLYTRADGLASYKEKYSQKEAEYNDILERSNQLTGGYEKLRDLRDSGNYREMFEALGVSEETVMDYALKLAEEEELPEDQRNLVRQNRSLEQELEKLRSQNEGYTQAQEEMSLKEDLNRLESVCNKEEYKDIVDALAKNGMSFFDDVKQTGVNIYNTENRDPSFEEVADIVAKRYRSFLPQQEQQQEQQVKVIERQPTIPSVKATNNAPVSETITSIEELRKLASQIPNR